MAVCEYGIELFERRVMTVTIVFLSILQLRLHHIESTLVKMAA